MSDNKNNNNIETFNKLDPYTPVEYAFIDWERSWKKCRCGRITKMNDNWCPSCGQKLTLPDFDD